MNDSAKAARAAYMRKWRAENRSKTRKYAEAYWTRRAKSESEEGEVKAYAKKESARACE